VVAYRPSRQLPSGCCSSSRRCTVSFSVTCCVPKEVPYRSMYRTCVSGMLGLYAREARYWKSSDELAPTVSTDTHEMEGDKYENRSVALLEG